MDFNLNNFGSKLVQPIICWMFFILLFFCAYVAISAQSFQPWMLIVVLPAIYLADGISGLAHLFLDYRPSKPQSGLRDLYYYEGDKGGEEYLSQKREVFKGISPLDKIVFDFKVHHLSPWALGNRSFAHLTLPTILSGGFPAIFLTLALIGFTDINPAIILFITVATGFLVLAQYAHACAHKRKIPFVPLIMQKLGLFLTQKKHRSHHRNLGVDFCILNGWANPIINRVFEHLFSKGKFDKKHLVPQE